MTRDATMSDTPPTAVQPTDTLVASLLPATAPTPEPARRVNFFKGLLLFWMLPKRYGPHLAVGSWRRAMVAHLIAVAFFVATMATVLMDSDPRGRSALHAVRIAAAQGVIQMAAASAVPGWDWAIAIMIIGAVPLEQLALLTLGAVFMPWCAGGDSAWSVWKRSTKNVYWSTTILIPISIGIAIAHGPLSRWSWLGGTRYEDILIVGLGILAFGTPVVLLLRALFTGASRYVGEPDGPAFAPREPRCDRCGYLIVKLPRETNCPECGLPVRDSLPGGRRRPTVWQEDEFRPRGWLEAVRMQWRILRDPGFSQWIPVHQGLTAARHFWWVTFCLIVLVVLATLRLLAWAATADRFAQTLGPAVVVILLIPLAMQTVMMFLGCLSAQWWHGIRDYRVSAIVCYYGSPLAWPFAAILLVLAIVTNEPVGPWLANYPIDVWRLHTNGVEAIGVALVLLMILALAFWWLRLSAGFRGAQHANV